MRDCPCEVEHVVVGGDAVGREPGAISERESETSRVDARARRRALDDRLLNAARSGQLPAALQKDGPSCEGVQRAGLAGTCEAKREHVDVPHRRRSRTPRRESALHLRECSLRRPGRRLGFRNLRRAARGVIRIAGRRAGVFDEGDEPPAGRRAEQEDGHSRGPCGGRDHDIEGQQPGLADHPHHPASAAGRLRTRTSARPARLKRG
mmetsp:Transcript_22847/g.73293  ORF Transcript_22847/g.73293 Transcript_22847/m.73293 type:complete len:207 (-) Transcript_22847:42-662(-)